MTLESYAKEKWEKEGNNSIPLVPTVAATSYSLEISIYDHTSISFFEIEDEVEEAGFNYLYDTLEKIYNCSNVDYSSWSGCYITFMLDKEDDTEANWNGIKGAILTYIEEARKYREKYDKENS